MIRLLLLKYMYIVYVVRAEFFTAIDGLEKLVDTESFLIDHLKNYVAEEKQRINTLKIYLLEHQNRHKLASLDPIEYFSNPINAFHITKRLTSEWNDIENIITNNLQTEFNQNLTNNLDEINFPTINDLNGAADALARLQVLYELNATIIATGEIGKTEFKTMMSASDCYQMGEQLYKNQDYTLAIQWFEEALKIVDALEDDFIIQILQKLAKSYEYNGNGRAALQIINELLSKDSNRVEHLKKKLLLKNRLKITEEDYVEFQKNTKKTTKELDLSNSNPFAYDEVQQNIYKNLCRNELKQLPSQLALLHCRYVTNKSAFLKLAPLKLEEVSHSPYIVIYHNVIYDTEIEIIKSLAKSKFKRAEVHITGQGISLADYRISKVAWLSDRKHKFIRNITNRVRDMTGLKTIKAEKLQVLNYGLGGHYEPHFDFAFDDDHYFDDLGLGNRIATVLFYMSDVTAGGATVFPLINVTLWPQKGSAAFWYNLYESGNVDVRTKHAGCPVLIGSKWVSNKWIHAVGEEFSRPCPLFPDHLANSIPQFEIK